MLEDGSKTESEEKVEEVEEDKQPTREEMLADCHEQLKDEVAFFMKEGVPNDVILTAIVYVLARFSHTVLLRKRDLLTAVSKTWFRTRHVRDRLKENTRESESRILTP